MNELIIHKINQLLLKDWDPIGIGNTGGAEDEYLQYVKNVYSIIQNSDSYTELFEYLWEIETEYMGLKGNKEKTERFAKDLFRQMKIR